MLFFKNITWANKRIVPEHERQSGDFKKKKKSHQTYLPTWSYFYYSSRGDFSLNVSIHHFSPLCGRTSVDPRASCSPSALVPSSWPFLCLEFTPEHRRLWTEYFCWGPWLDLELAFLSHLPDLKGDPGSVLTRAGCHYSTCEFFSSRSAFHETWIQFHLFILRKSIYFYWWILDTQKVFF